LIFYCPARKMVTLPKEAQDLTLPIQRVKMIMKSCPDIEAVPQESLHLVTRATELFIAYLAKESYAQSESAAETNRLFYDSLSELVKSKNNLDFLAETVPSKITWAECQKLIEAKPSRIEDMI